MQKKIIVSYHLTMTVYLDLNKKKCQNAALLVKLTMNINH
jgi:hypothetical protein